MRKRDFYEILGIPRTASAEDIRKAHRKLSKQFHPDLNKGSAKAEAQFKEVQEAHEVLADPAKRKIYDQYGHAGLEHGQVPPGADPFESLRRAQQHPGRSGQRSGQRTWRPSANVSVEDLDMGDAGFADIFEQFFGGAAGARGAAAGQRPRQREHQAPRGEDIEYPVTLTFAQAARGMTLPLQISRDGRIETIEVKIPAGVKDGSRIRLKGQGQHADGQPGDLFIVTRVLPHPYFTRDGLDILLDVPVSLYEALLGTKVEVPTLDGPLVIMVPPGTSAGTKLRIRERGFHRGAEKGDQYCVIKIVVPRTLDDEDKQLLQKLQSKHPVEARKDMQW